MINLNKEYGSIFFLFFFADGQFLERHFYRRGLKVSCHIIFIDDTLKIPNGLQLSYKLIRFGPFPCQNLGLDEKINSRTTPTLAIWKTRILCSRRPSPFTTLTEQKRIRTVELKQQPMFKHYCTAVLHAELFYILMQIKTGRYSQG